MKDKELMIQIDFSSILIQSHSIPLKWYATI